MTRSKSAHACPRLFLWEAGLRMVMVGLSPLTQETLLIDCACEALKVSCACKPPCLAMKDPKWSIMGGGMRDGSASKVPELDSQYPLERAYHSDACFSSQWQQSGDRQDPWGCWPGCLTPLTQVPGRNPVSKNTVCGVWGGRWLSTHPHAHNHSSTHMYTHREKHEERIFKTYSCVWERESLTSCYT